MSVMLHVFLRVAESNRVYLKNLVVRFWGSLRNKLLVSFLLLSITPLVMMGVISFVNSSNALQESAFGQLSAIRAIKASKVENYFAGKRSEMAALTAAVLTLRQETFNRLDAVCIIKRDQIQAYFAERQSDTEALAQSLVLLLGDEVNESNIARAVEAPPIQKYLAQFNSDNRYDDLYLIRPDGFLFFSLDHGADYQTNVLTGPYKDTILGQLVASILESGRFQISDYDRYRPDGYVPVAFMGQPVIRNGHVISIVVLKSPIRTIDSLVHEHSQLGVTGETYLAGYWLGHWPNIPPYAVLFRSSLSEVGETAILNPAYTPSRTPAEESLAGQTNHGTIQNYLGDPVLASWTPLNIPGLEWFLVSETNLETAFSPSLQGTQKDLFTQYKEQYGYRDLLLISPKGGYVFYSVAHQPDYQTSLFTGSFRNSNLAKLVLQVLETKSFGMSDYERYVPSQSAPSAFMAQPLLDSSGQVAEIVVAELSLDQVVGIMKENTGLGETGETFLVGPDHLWRSESRFAGLNVKSTILDPKVRVDTTASAQALAGELGIQKVDNYRGERVLSAWSPVTIYAGSRTSDAIRWGLIAEVDEDEVNQPVTRIAVIAVGLLIGAILLVSSITYFVSHNVSAPIVKVANAATAVAQGDFTQRVHMQTGDEVEQMAEAFNDMSGRIAAMVDKLQIEISARKQAQDLLQKARDELSVLYGVSAFANQSLNLQVFLSESLSRAAQALQSDRGVILLLEGAAAVGQTPKLSPAAYYGIQMDGLEHIHSTTGNRGITSWIIEHREPLLVSDLSADSRFSDEMRQMGNVSLVLAPIRAEAKVLGIMGLARPSQREYLDEEIVLLSSITDQIGVIIQSDYLRQRAQRASLLEERQRIARDLHDSVTQALYGLMLLADAGRESAEAADLAQTRSQVKEMSQIAHQALKEMRLLIYELRPQNLEREGLIGGLQQRLKTVENHAGIQTQLVTESDVAISVEMESALYRITQEALNNILRHSGATRVSLHLSSDDTHVCLQIEDNGTGFDPSSTSTRAGIGLASMRERAERLGGTLEITSRRGKGTRIRLCLPCNPLVIAKVEEAYHQSTPNHVLENATHSDHG